MSIVQSLKSEIQRLSRRELKAAITPIHASTVALKKTVADLKKRIAALEAGNKRLLQPQKTVQDGQQSAEAPEKIRITAKSIRALRSKLGLSQADFGKLIGVSSQNVFVMEHKEGRLRVRKKTLANLLVVRGIERREAKEHLREVIEATISSKQTK